MKSFLSKYHLQLFFFAVALESLAANFAHPITPTLIQNLQLPDYSFGMLYAGMAFTNFLFSPFWAKQEAAGLWVSAVWATASDSCCLPS